MTNVNTTYCYQRPPSVGMPRHALRRRMPNTFQQRSRSPARCRDFLFDKFARLGEGPFARFKIQVFPTPKRACDFDDLLN